MPSRKGLYESNQQPPTPHSRCGCCRGGRGRGCPAAHHKYVPEGHGQTRHKIDSSARAKDIALICRGAPAGWLKGRKGLCESKQCLLSFYSRCGCGGGRRCGGRGGQSRAGCCCRAGGGRPAKPYDWYLSTHARGIATAGCSRVRTRKAGGQMGRSRKERRESEASTADPLLTLWLLWWSPLWWWWWSSSSSWLWLWWSWLSSSSCKATRRRKAAVAIDWRLSPQARGAVD